MFEAGHKTYGQISETNLKVSTKLKSHTIEAGHKNVSETKFKFPVKLKAICWRQGTT